MMDIAEIKNSLSLKLKPDRYTHSLGVAYTASCLAMRYGENIEKAYLTGLLHDCAKFMSREELIDCCKAHGYIPNKEELLNPYALLHSKAGAFLAKEEYGADDDICNAISYHTTGKPAMNLLEKIIFVSDYIEYHRKTIPGLDIVRQKAFVDLDDCIACVCENTIAYLNSLDNGVAIDSTTIETYNYYKK